MSRVSQGEAWRRVRRVIARSDLVVEVLDARDPLETRNRRMESMVVEMGKRLILAINKADLVPLNILREWGRCLRREFPTVFLSAKGRLGTRRLLVAIRENAPRLPVTVSVVGYPNVGKSTIINYLKGRHVAETSPMPGWTRGEQVVRAKTWLRVIDTPGVIPPDELRDEASLVLKGAIDPFRLSDPVPPAISLISRVMRYNPGAFAERYGVESTDPMAVLEGIAKYRGLLLRGGVPNVREAAVAVILDWLNGRLTYYYSPRGVLEGC